MIQAKIESLLQEKIGIAASILGSREMARSIEKRRLACKLPDLQTYLQKLQTSAQELDELIELVIVPETWFFRDTKPFIFLENHIKSEWTLNKSKSSLRLLSIPCSTGEEPYSIAMTLLNVGLSPSQFIIDAVDISKKSLTKAQQGLYTRNSFRGEDLAFRSHYFTEVGDKFQLCDRVKNTVNFIHGNLVASDCLSDKSPYDLIFCRNVLIYFEQKERQRSMVNLERLLANQGLIFVGHAETGQVSPTIFEPMRHTLAFAYRKIAQDNPKSKSPQQIEGLLNKNNYSKNHHKFGSQTTINSQPSMPKQVATTMLLSDEQKPKLPTIINLRSIRELADTGHLSEATKLCEIYLQQNSTDVEAYVLLGQIYQGQGMEIQAEKSFQKALYLQPNQYNALVHLTLITENRGDTVKAAVLRQRILRSQSF
jgi:chemotaxis protein methyltransferase WspC